MDKRNLFLVLSALIVVALGMLWWLGAPSSKHVPQTPAEATPTVAPYGSPQPDIAEATPTGRQIPGGAYEPSDPRWKEVHAKDLVDQAWEWRMPINFYGRVLDENEQPVPGAQSRVKLDGSFASRQFAIADDNGCAGLLFTT